MLTPAEAAAAIEARLARLPAEDCAVGSAAGRVLCEDVRAERDQPPFDRVAMDGIAVSAAAFAAGRRTFRVAGTVAAGSEPPALPGPDACLEVMTGAMLPAGADAVVPVEALEVAGGVATIDAAQACDRWSNIHRRGTDASAGSVALRTGTRLRGPEIAIAASAGRASVLVTREPRIGVISTGDELVRPGEPLAPWQIRRSNVVGVAAILTLHGWRRVADDHVRDDPERIRACLAEHLASDDVVILSGGVSAGRFDHVPGALEALGVERVFHKVAQRPGKPFWFGVTPSGRPVFALPGNPVSTLVCLVRYVLPALARLAGQEPPPRPAHVQLAAAWDPHPALTAFVPVDHAAGAPPGVVALHPTHGSGDFTSLSGTAGFVELAPGTRVKPGDPVPFYTW